MPESLLRRVSHHGPIKLHRRQDQEGEDHADQGAARRQSRLVHAAARQGGEEIAEAGQGRPTRGQETRQSGHGCRLVRSFISPLPRVITHLS